MSRFGHPEGLLGPPLGAVLVGRFALAHGHRYDTHAHPTTISCGHRGVVTVGVYDAVWVLPSSRALFIPAELPHTTAATTSQRCTACSAPGTDSLREADRAAERSVEATRTEHIAALQQGVVVAQDESGRSEGAIVSALADLAQRFSTLDKMLTLLGSR